MTETLDRTATATATVTKWLFRFEQTLNSGDVAAAAALFTEDSYWRDLIAFTWNLKTSEGPEQIAAMLTETLAHAGPSGWKIATAESAASADGHRSLDRIRDGGGPRARTPAAEG